jgi:HK97 family phage major capsid protein
MVATDAAIVSGTGSSQPYGLTETSVLTTVTGTVSTGDKIGYKDLTALFYGTPQQFRTNGAWLMNSTTLSKIANLLDASLRPIFMPNYGFIGDSPGGGSTWLNGSLLGRPIIISENVADLATTGNRAIYYADFKSLYYMLDRVSPTIKVNDQPAYKNGAYEFVLRARRGGRIVQPNAGRVLVSQ